MAYTKLGWVNDQAPALNQTNLNHMDQGIYDAHSELAEYEDIFTGDVADLRSALTYDVNGLYPLDTNAHKNSYIDKNNGKLTAYSGWKASDFIPCKEGTKLHFLTNSTQTIYNAFYESADESDFLSAFTIPTGESDVKVPIGAKYFRISNSNTAYSSMKMDGIYQAQINAIDDLAETINLGRKDIGVFIVGEYVDNTTGEFVTASNYKRTGYIDISEYDGQIYFTSNVRTGYCAFYDSNYDKVGVFTIYIGETLVTIPSDAVYCAFSLSRYNDAEVIMYDNTMSLLKSLGIANIRDINLKYLAQTDILTQMIGKPLILVYTDIHGNGSNFDRMTRFYNDNVNSNVWYPINLGDTVADQATDSVAFMDNYLGKASLMVLGNHDLLISGVMPAITSLEAYTKYIAPNVSSWGVTQPANASTNGYTYYYKDKSYSGGTIRLIVLDEYFYDETQHNWFVATLADANTNGYSVIVCQHQSNVLANQASPLNDKKAFATPELGFDLYVTTAGYSGAYASANEARIMAVDDFIGNGGKFICWMSGHTHSDQCHTFTRTHGKQLSLVFSNAGMSMTSSKRIANYSSDCFQYVAVDLAKKYVYVLRIGEAVDMWFHKNEFMLYDYANHEVVEYH